MLICGFASYSFHASLTRASLFFDVGSIPQILLYMGIYSFLNLFLEDLNRI